MFDFSDFFTELKDCISPELIDKLSGATDEALANVIHGDWPVWQAALSELPELTTSKVKLNSDYVTVQTADEMDAATSRRLKDALLKLHPWRKGPFELFGTKIDAEWRSDMKWRRIGLQIGSRIKPLAGQVVLDVGCGNGYYGLRMLGQGARAVIGIDPSLLFGCQYQAINKYVRTRQVGVLPLGIEQFPPASRCFDSVFSMGILYHRKEPREHLRQLKEALTEDGQLILETLVLTGKNDQILQPSGRYAKMRNVWNIPSVSVLQQWLKECGFRDSQVVDITPTTVNEQRGTEWMHYESLADFLDSENPNLTVEGHPAPVRAVVVANILNGYA